MASKKTVPGRKKSSSAGETNTKAAASATNRSSERTSLSPGATSNGKPNASSGKGNIPSNSLNSASNGSSKNTSKKEKKSEKNLETLFEDILKDVYSAETQLVEALPEMAEAVHSEDLQDAMEHHLKETKKHVERLEKIFTKLRIDKSDVKKCEAMEGLLKENKHILEEYEEGPVRDSALIIGAQKVEHYEIASYGSLCELADVLGWRKVGEILGRTMEEEVNADETLTEISRNVNDEAYELTDVEEEDNY